jgi:hypothetical protein
VGDEEEDVVLALQIGVFFYSTHGFKKVLLRSSSFSYFLFIHARIPRLAVEWDRGFRHGWRFGFSDFCFLFVLSLWKGRQVSRRHVLPCATLSGDRVEAS